MPTKMKKYFTADPKLDILAQLGLNTENLPELSDMNLEELMAPQVTPAQPEAPRKELSNLFGLLSEQPTMQVPERLKGRLSPTEIAEVQAPPSKTARIVQILSWLGGPATGIPGLIIGQGMKAGEQKKKEAIITQAQEQQNKLEQIYATGLAHAMAQKPTGLPNVGTEVEAAASELFKDKVPNYAGYNSLSGAQQAVVTAEVRRRAPGQWIPTQNPDGSISYTFVGRREGGGPGGPTPAGLTPPKEKIPTNEIKDIATSVAALDNLDIMLERAASGKLPTGLKGLLVKRVSSNETARAVQGQLENLLKRKLIDQTTYEYIAAFNQFRLSAQSIIKGIPSNYDVLTLLETIGSIEMPEEQRRVLLQYSKHLFTKIIEHSVALQRAAGRSVPPEFLNILQSAGINPDTAQLRAYKSLPDTATMLRTTTGASAAKETKPTSESAKPQQPPMKFKKQINRFMVEEE